MPKYCSEKQIKLKTYIILILAVGILASANLVFAQTHITCASCVQIPPDEIDLYKELFPLIVWTNNYVYDHSSVIEVNGFLRPQNAISPVTVTVTDPIGNIVAVDQTTPDPDGDFKFLFNTASPNWKKDGDYVIKVNSGSANRQFKTSVSVVSYDIGTKHVCSNNEITVNANNGGIYCIPFKVNKGETTGVDGFLDLSTKTLSIDIRGTGVESILLNIPRYLIDSKTESGDDSSFVVMSGGQIVDYEEVESDSQTRQIKLDYTPSRRNSFQIIGTNVVPEFGMLSIMILVLSIISVVVFGRAFSHKFVNI